VINIFVLNSTFLKSYKIEKALKSKTIPETSFFSYFYITLKERIYFEEELS
jgi:hypothetical protein